MKTTEKQPLHVVVGLGLTGMSCVRYCIREGLNFAVTDSRENPPGKEELEKLAPKAPAVFGRLDSELIQNAAELIISPGVSLKEPEIAKAIAKGIPYAGDVELFIRKIKAPIIGITGANAKSTTTALVGEMARQAGINVQVAGNIGLPVLDVLNDQSADLYVLELSSFQLETTHSLRAEVAAILNVTEDHMDRYANMEEYTAAKHRIYVGAKHAVFNRRDPLTKPTVPCQRVSFGLTEPSANEFGVRTHHGELYLARGEELLLLAQAVKIKGMHNIENALAALAIGSCAGFPLEAMLETLKTFSGLPHRCQFILKSGGISWYNDSKGTNVGATIAALEGLGVGIKGKIVLIAGGIGKGADFSPLRESVKKYVRKLILIGEAAKQLAVVLDGCCDMEHAGDSIDGAIKKADLAALRGDLVLLSPACASFDMFNNYKHRGDVFMEKVQALAQGNDQ
ncbi:MAG: UDP-N-acetylmuramoyl-L-alanine--D-glutamate ligase [Pseudomonadota bacterium]|nr:UDP-N-acetylmuramoyl-L-alanine--D-glutamate ligase [Gammaproteobacteria bacterium]MBU1558669.1 UDP-N-acetylmuramoyl-L-alanine--D-glutamate ligase [Gammaproteobacteria bacterium]MBU1926869.1 UDP-N-acetylmuramoyl-L-alanine--D-glutamate ligase [Gammaproteobacteria bacterium]MBU2546134.1 UDP-N-acetylmuramoyl-L-alanine--D-glutamate ligase [Gammaproteobacteria bacterium]